jgi:RHS repeat-associated protein
MTGDGINTLTYDSENHAVTSSGTYGTGQYVYDGKGVRVEKCLSTCGSPTTYTVYIFAGSKVIAEYDNGAAVTSPSREYLYNGGQLMATINSSGMQYHIPDHLSVRVTTNSSGSEIGQQGHFPYGESWYVSSTTTNWQFTTYERDAESSNDYAQARYNVNRLGRFASPDPIAGNIGDLQSLNRYSYVRNQPTNLMDPSGMFSCGYAKNQKHDLDRGDDSGPSEDGASDLVQDDGGNCWLDPGDGGGGGYGYGNPNGLSGGVDCIIEYQQGDLDYGGLNACLGDNQGGGQQGNPGQGGGGNGTGTTGNLPLSALGQCTASLFGVTAVSFTPSTSESNGSFTGAMSGVYAGYGQPLQSGPSIFTVTNNSTQFTTYTVTQWYNLNPAGPPVAPGGVVGLTDPQHPFTNTTGSNQVPSEIVNTQVWELGNSLAAITQRVPQTLNVLPGPSNNEPGNTLTLCIAAQAASQLHF